MSQARIRNMSWVYDHAKQHASEKGGMMRGMVTIGEVVKSLGFSRNTVQKYFDALIEQGHMMCIVKTKSVQIYIVLEVRHAKQ